MRGNAEILFGSIVRKTGIIRTSPRSASNTSQGLTNSLEQTKERLVMNTTRKSNIRANSNDDSCVEIPLTQGLVALVDKSDVELVSRHKWYALNGGRTFYAVTKTYRRNASWNMLQMHRLLTGFALTDHIDGNGLNNRRCNLREATNAENQRNMRKQLGTSSYYKGVTLHRQTGKFQAQIKVPSDVGRGRYRYLGLFVNEIDAARAYDEAARELYGEFAAFNFPLSGERSAMRETA